MSASDAPILTTHALICLSLWELIILDNHLKRELCFFFTVLTGAICCCFGNKHLLFLMLLKHLWIDVKHKERGKGGGRVQWLLRLVLVHHSWGLSLSERSHTHINNPMTFSRNQFSKNNKEIIYKGRLCQISCGTHLTAKAV